MNSDDILSKAVTEYFCGHSHQLPVASKGPLIPADFLTSMALWEAFNTSLNPNPKTLNLKP